MRRIKNINKNILEEVESRILSGFGESERDALIEQTRTEFEDGVLLDSEENETTPLCARQ